MRVEVRVVHTQGFFVALFGYEREDVPSLRQELVPDDSAFLVSRRICENSRDLSSSKI